MSRRSPPLGGGTTCQVDTAPARSPTTRVRSPIRKPSAVTGVARPRGRPARPPSPSGCPCRACRSAGPGPADVPTKRSSPRPSRASAVTTPRTPSGLERLLLAARADQRLLLDDRSGRRAPRARPGPPSTAPDSGAAASEARRSGAWPRDRAPAARPKTGCGRHASACRPGTRRRTPCRAGSPARPRCRWRSGPCRAPPPRSTRAPSSAAIGTAGGSAPPVSEMNSSAPPRVTTKAISRYSSTPERAPRRGRRRVARRRRIGAGQRRAAAA